MNVSFQVKPLTSRYSLMSSWWTKTDFMMHSQMTKTPIMMMTCCPQSNKWTHVRITKQQTNSVCVWRKFNYVLRPIALSLNLSGSTRCSPKYHHYEEDRRLSRMFSSSSCRHQNDHCVMTRWWRLKSHVINISNRKR